MAKPNFRIDLPDPPGPSVTRELMSAPPTSQRSSRHARSPRISPWPGNITSPGLNVEPEAVDYFHRTSKTEHSTRALTSLALVVGGRCTVAVGLGAVASGFRNGTTQPYAAGGSAVGIGLLLTAGGIARSYNDTLLLHARRARVSAAASILGALMVAGGGILVSVSIGRERHLKGVYEALPLRTVGNALVFGAIPNAFSAAEIVHGDVPIAHRVLTRDLATALAGAFLMAWAHLSSPDPPSPLWVREVAQCGGIVCLALSGALARTDMSRAQANTRLAMMRRRASSMGTGRS